MHVAEKEGNKEKGNYETEPSQKQKKTCQENYVKNIEQSIKNQCKMGSKNMGNHQKIN